MLVLAEFLDDSPGDEDGVPLEEDHRDDLEKPAALHLAPEEVAKEGEVAEERAHGDDGGHDGPRGVEAARCEGQPEVEEVVGEGPLLKQSILEQSQFTANASIGALAICVVIEIVEFFQKTLASDSLHQQPSQCATQDGPAVDIERIRYFELK